MEFEYSALNPASPVTYASFGAMNTRMEIVAVHLSEEDARELCERIGTLTRELEAGLSRHVPGSVFARINAGEAVAVDEETFWVLEMCEAMRGATGGYFDVAALSADRTRPAYMTDPATRTVRTASPDIILDAGAFAKGFALDKIKKELEAAGVRSALVNFGDSSMLGVGSHPFGDHWPVRVGAGETGLRDCALSVSGKTPSGRAHIVDPHTGRPVGSDELVAVRGRSALVCEILSTALYAAPAHERTKIAASFDGYEMTIEETK